MRVGARLGQNAVNKPGRCLDPRRSFEESAQFIRFTQKLAGAIGLPEKRPGRFHIFRRPAREIGTKPVHALLKFTQGHVSNVFWHIDLISENISNVTDAIESSPACQKLCNVIDVGYAFDLVNDRFECTLGEAGEFAPRIAQVEKTCGQLPIAVDGVFFTDRRA